VGGCVCVCGRGCGPQRLCAAELVAAERLQLERRLLPEHAQGMGEAERAEVEARLQALAAKQAVRAAAKKTLKRNNGSGAEKEGEGGARTVGCSAAVP
jgi:hypothetical protein